MSVSVLKVDLYLSLGLKCNFCPLVRREADFATTGLHIWVCTFLSNLNQVCVMTSLSSLLLVCKYFSLINSCNMDMSNHNVFPIQEIYSNTKHSHLREHGFSNIYANLGEHALLPTENIYIPFNQRHLFAGSCSSNNIIKCWLIRSKSHGLSGTISDNEQSII